MIFHYFLEAKDRNNDAKGQKGGKEITMSFIRFLLQPWIDELLTAARAECFRCFKHHVNCNPRQYSKLLDLRFAAAIYTRSPRLKTAPSSPPWDIAQPSELFLSPF
jgi:hypothetical protein